MNLLYVVESGDYKYLVFDEMPDKISTKYGDDNQRIERKPHVIKISLAGERKRS